MTIENHASARIDLANVLHNISELKKLTAPAVKFMAVVKADAYGHGAVAVSKAVSDKVDYLSVSSVSEAMELRRSGIDKPVLILSETAASNAGYVIENDLIQTVYTIKLAEALSREAVKQKKQVRVHFKIDTGMGRVGAQINEAEDIFKKISSLPGINIEGIFTHLARAEEKNGFTVEQLKKFNDVASKLRSGKTMLHAANSAAAIYHRNSHLDMIRIGLSMYGLYPPGGDKDGILLKPALEFRTRVVYLKRVPAGTPLSYGSTHVTGDPTTIVTIPVGYADGLPRLLSNKGSVLIKGGKYPIVGRVCMDMTLVDVKNDNIVVGDEVVLIGSQGKEALSADDVASLAGTISYEIICGIGKRVPRIHIK